SPPGSACSAPTRAGCRARASGAGRGREHTPMPEIPDLEAIRHYLYPRLEDHTVTATTAPMPWLVRTGAEALDTLVGHGFTGIGRLGKFLLFTVDDGRVLVINPMLTGR